MNSRAKGVRRELDFRDLLREFGWNAERGQQHSGNRDAPDVRHNLEGFHFEVKGVERLRLGEAIEQAWRDAEGLVPVVAWKRSRHEWVAILPMSELLALVRHRSQAF